jgi:hypothetical protein
MKFIFLISTNIHHIPNLAILQYLTFQNWLIQLIVKVSQLSVLN